MNVKRLLWIVVSIVLFLLIRFLPLGLEPQAQFVLAVLVLAMVLWFTEALPLHVTALIIAVMLYLSAGFSPNAVFAPFADPVIFLMLGGFVLAVGMQKHGLDKRVALWSLNAVGTKPKRFLLGMMAVTAFLSMWMSNTASTAIMLPIALVVLVENGLVKLKSSYGKAVVLGIAYAATIGGIGTIVGSPPNAIAVKFLADQGIRIGFLEWMFYGMPIVLVMLPIAWLVVLLFHKPEVSDLKVSIQVPRFTKKEKMVSLVFVLTAVGWLSSNFTGINSSIIAMLPIVLFYFMRLLDVDDFGKANWPTLILLGGGLSLGSAISSSGLDKAFAAVLGDLIVGQPLLVIFLAVAFTTVVLTMVASNTATASILVPIFIPLAALLGVDLRLLAVVGAIAASVDFIVPVGTPPSAIAYSSGYIRTMDMVKAGSVLAVIGIVVVALFAAFVW